MTQVLLLLLLLFTLLANSRQISLETNVAVVFITKQVLQHDVFVVQLSIRVVKNEKKKKRYDIKYLFLPGLEGIKIFFAFSFACSHTSHSLEQLRQHTALGKNTLFSLNARLFHVGNLLVNLGKLGILFGSSSVLRLEM